MRIVKVYLLILISLLRIPNVVAADQDVLIDGLITDQVISRVGQLFYDELLNGWEPPYFPGNISVRERPDNISGNVVWIEIDNDVVFEDRVGFVANAIDAKALDAREKIESYIFENKEALKGLEGIN